jgi:asparagine synthase (glutamine-hydrolysing)
MCGIAGVVHIDPGAPVDRELLHRMTTVLRHRGPDAETVHVWRGAGLAHRRLSIIDLSTGDQPMFNAAGTAAVVFNGEIYNFRELRQTLAAGGHRFRTQSDTEVIVHAYDAYGSACVERLRGMFAFAIWDDARRRLVLARDRAGKKPLYYHWSGERLLFASEIKALLEDRAVKREIRIEAIDDYLTFGVIPPPDTVFRGISQLLPATVLVLEGGRLDVRRYWDVVFRPSAPRPEAALVEEFDALFDQAVAERLVADVPLGAFLSGGVDSSAVVASMARQSAREVVTTTVGFVERSHSELAHARAVARAVGSRHHEILVRPDAVEDLPRLVWHLDQPFADSSALPTYWVSRAARDHVTVALSGDGGDELFAGYQRRYGIHRLENRLRRWIPGPVRRGLLGPIGRHYPRSRWIPRPLRAGLVLSNLALSFERAYCEDLSLFRSEERALLLDLDYARQVREHDPLAGHLQHFARVPGLDPLSRVLYVDFKTWLADDILVKVDRMSMACSLEVRSPLLDHRIVEFAATLPPGLKLNGRVSKYLLKRHLERRIPAETIHRPKQGFEIPVATWLRRDLRAIAHDLLFSERAAQRGYLRRRRVQAIWDAHQRGTRDYAAQIWALMVLELWHRQCLDR